MSKQRHISEPLSERPGSMPSARGDAPRDDEWACWLKAAMAGDAVAYRRFLEAVTPHLRSMARYHCYRFGGQDNDVEDVVQEVLLAIHLKRGTWDASRPISPWLSAIVRNKLVDILRRRNWAATVPIEDVAEVLAAPDGHNGLHAGDIERLLDRLKVTQREIVRSISIDGCSVRETAVRLSMSEGAVRVALHRALRALAIAFRGQP